MEWNGIGEMGNISGKGRVVVQLLVFEINPGVILWLPRQTDVYSVYLEAK